MNSTTVTLTRQGVTGAVTVDREYPTTVADLWSAISETERLARWLVIVQGEPAIGKPVKLSFTSGWEGTGVIEVCEPPRRLVITSSDEQGSTTLTATITATVSGARLQVTEAGLSITQLPGYGAGWKVHLDDLAVSLAGGQPRPFEEQFRANLASLSAT